MIAIAILAASTAYLLFRNFRHQMTIVEYIKQFCELDTWNTNAQVALQELLDKDGEFAAEEIGHILGILQGEELEKGEK